MNQPTNPCYGSLPLFGEYDNPIDGIAADAPHSYNTAQLQQEEHDPGLADSESYEEYGDIEMDGPGGPAVSVPSGAGKHSPVVRPLWVISGLISTQSKDVKMFTILGRRSRSGLLHPGSYVLILAWWPSTVSCCLTL